MTEQKKYPVVPLRGSVLFPGHVLPFVAQHAETVRAVEAASKAEGKVFAVARRDESGKEDELYNMGVVAQLGMTQRGPGGMSMILQAEDRAYAARYQKEGEHLAATVNLVSEMPPLNPDDPAFQALFNETRERARDLGKAYGIPDEAVRQVVEGIKGPGPFTDQVAGFLDLPLDEKQQVLETLGIEERMRKVLVHIEQRIGFIKAKEQIKSEVQEKLGKRQREMYLREQLQAIQRELGEGDDQPSDMKELRDRLAELDLPETVQTEVDREMARLDRAGPQSSESQVSRTFLEWIVELPWNARSEDQLDLKKASEILDEDHYGLRDVKDRILEFLAVRRLRAEQAGTETASDDQKSDNLEVKSRAMAKGPILLFAGPPGVGKTSIAKSIARSLNREYVRVSLGGTRDEADIRGHRRTYVGALPGRIVQGLKQAGTKNPVFLLDEVDKLGISFQGDPASALMEVLDPAQNDSFVDHYLGVPFDLSEVLFVATANFIQNIPGPLLDRMEVVEFTGYTAEEKLHIAKGYLILRQREESGLTAEDVVFGDEALRHVIGSYTRESGVRQLEREIGRLARKVARKIAVGQSSSIELEEADVRDLLGRPKVRQERAGKEDEIGVATGMYYTPAGGDIMFVEASVRELAPAPRDDNRRFDGLGAVSLILTGQLGDVMKESARAALTYAATHAADLDIPAEHLGSVEAHIHVPAGAIPKDGPSAGVTLATALASVMSGRPVSKDVAMTGEITLRGHVLPIGGIKEKVLGAHRAGIKNIVLPKENEADLEEIPEEVKKELLFHSVETLDEVLNLALLPPSRHPYALHSSILSTGGQPIQLA